MPAKEQFPIVVFSDGIPPFVIGGMQKHSRLLVEYIARTGQPVILYHYVPHGIEVPADSKIRSFFSDEANAHLEIRTFVYPKEDRFPGHYIRAQRKTSRMYVMRLLKEDSIPTLVLCKGFMVSELISRKDQLPSTTKIAVNFHGMNMYQQQPNWNGELVKWMLRLPVQNIMNKVDAVFSYGGKITSIIKAQIQDESKIVELPSGIDSSWIRDPRDIDFRQISGRRKLLFVGRWDRLKGLQELHEVISCRLDLNFQLTLVGPIPKKHQLDDPRLHYLGPINETERLKAIYDDHEVLLCPSISEGMPNVIMEAMARGLAIMATDVGATAQLVDDSVGWLIPPKDKENLEKALMRTVFDEDINEKGRSAILRMRDEFDWEVIADRFLYWYSNFAQRDL